jgi:thioesterase domain-containing protein
MTTRELPTSGRSTLVPIQPSGSRPAFYAVPGAEGDVYCYVRLARHLGPSQPFYAFEPPGVDGSEPAMRSIQALAARYLADLRAAQSEGPYFIGGFCVGGIVAFELARQLMTSGQEVALLALFETPSPSGLTRWGRALGTLRYRRDVLPARLRWLASQSWPQRIGFVRSRLSRFSSRRSPDRGWEEQPKDRVFRATFEAVHAYVGGVRPYTGRIVLFLGSPALRRAIYWRQLDWAHVAAGGLEVRTGIDGCIDHAMMLRDPAHVHALADLLRPYLSHLPSR